MLVTKQTNLASSKIIKSLLSISCLFVANIFLKFDALMIHKKSA